MQKSVDEVRWWMRRRPVFLATMALVTTAIVLAGWFTGLRDVFQGAAVSIAIVAFLPFIVIGIGLVLIAFCVVVCALTEGAADPIGVVDCGGGLVGAGARMIGPYYRFLNRLRRHPVIWGVCSGVVFGCAVLGLVIAVKILPAEMDTADTLADAKARIDEHYAKRGVYPRPGPNGELVLAGETVRDGFGNPLDYRVFGQWKLASYRLSSRGYDGDAGTADDMCVHGATRLASVVSDVTTLLDKFRSKTATRSDRLAGTRALRCQ